MRKGLQNQRAELVKELDGVQTDMVRAAVDAGQATIDADNRAWEQRVSVAKRGAKDIIEANDPIAKANAEYSKSLEQLNKFKPDISAEDYDTAFKAITKSRDDAIERAEKSANTMTIEGKAVWSVAESYNALVLELNSAKLATEALRLGEGTIIDVKANERVTDFLTDFGKKANIVGKSLAELAQAAGVSLDDLREGFRAIEVERAKVNALKRAKDLATETEETKRRADATLQGASAAAEMAKSIEVERQLRAMGLDAKDKDLQALRSEIAAKLEAAEASREYLQAAQEGQSILERYGDGATRLRLGLEKLNETQRVLAQNGKMTPELEEAFSRAAWDIAKQTKTVEGAFFRAFDDIGDAWEDLFDKMVKGSKVTFRDFASSLKDIFTKTLAEMAYIAPMRPVSVNILPLIEQ